MSISVGTKVILKGYKGDLKHLNNKIGKVIKLIMKNGKITQVYLTFPKSVWQLKPIKAEILVWSANVQNVIPLQRTPILVGRVPILETQEECFNEV